MADKRSPLTVAQVIERLQSFPKDLPLYVETGHFDPAQIPVSFYLSPGGESVHMDVEGPDG